MKVSLDIRVFNWLLSVDIKKSRIAEYEKAAYHAWDRYRLYNQYYKDCKTEHQIALMTMLDISVHPFINYWSKDEEKVTIELPVFDEILTPNVILGIIKLMKRLRVSQRSQGWLWWISALRNSIHPLLMIHQRKRVLLPRPHISIITHPYSNFLLRCAQIRRTFLLSLRRNQWK